MYKIELSESHFPAVDSEPVLETTVGSVIREAALNAPDTIALIEGISDPSTRRRWTYKELLAETEKVSRALCSRYEPGERVAIWANNIPEWVIMEFAAAIAGVVLVTVNPVYKPKELEYVLSQSEAAGLYLIPEYRGESLLDSVASVRHNLPHLRDIVNILDWTAVCSLGERSPEFPDVTPDFPVQIQYTSGTTGFPKGVFLHHRGITNNARFCAQRFNFTENDSWINFMPLFHTAGCVMSVLGAVQAKGTQIVVPNFKADLVLDLIEQEKATSFFAVPTMLIGLMEMQAKTPRDISSLRGAVTGGSMVSRALARRVRAELDISLQILFGQTETSPVLTVAWENDSEEDLTTTIGQPLPQTEIAIKDKDGNIQPVGEVGEICIRGYSVMYGYYNMPEETAKTIDADEWLHTGDLGCMDSRGYLKITGRLKDMVIRGGENIFPAEIENVILEHPAVDQAIVIGVPDEQWGEVLVGFVRSANSSIVPGAGEIMDHCLNYLSRHKVPKQWVYIDEWPVTPSGKIQKFVLREAFIAGEYTVATKETTTV